MKFFRDFLRTVLLGPGKVYGSKISSSENVYYTQFVFTNISSVHLLQSQYIMMFVLITTSVG